MNDTVKIEIESDMIEVNIINREGTRYSFFIEKFEVRNFVSEFRSVAERDESLFCRRVYSKAESSFVPCTLYMPYEVLANSMLIVGIGSDE